MWIPAVARQWRGLSANVIGYAGIGDRPWGLVKLMDALDLTTASTWLAGPGRYVVLMVCALVPAALAWARPRATMECVALSMASFLALSPAFGVQYLTWAVTASVLLGTMSGLVYSLASGLLLFVVYADWNSGLDWTAIAPGRPFVPGELLMGFGVWTTLIAVMVRGMQALPSSGGLPVVRVAVPIAASSLDRLSERARPESSRVLVPTPEGPAHAPTDHHRHSSVDH